MKTISRVLHIFAVLTLVTGVTKSVCAQETVSAPTSISGPGTGYPFQVLTFTASGAVSSVGNPMQYQFDWGNYTQSPWGSATQSVWYSDGGVDYTFCDITARARDAINTNIVSAWSSSSLNLVIYGDCGFSISPSSTNMSSLSQAGSFTINSTRGCGWLANATADWVHTSSSGSGSGTINYTMDANSGPIARSGIITVGGQNFTVIQAGLGIGAMALQPPFDPSTEDAIVASGNGIHNQEAETESAEVFNDKIYYAIHTDGSSTPSKIYRFDPISASNMVVLGETSDQFWALKTMQGRLWVSHTDGELRKSADGVNFTLETGTPFSSANFVTAMAEFNGQMYFATSAGQIYLSSDGVNFSFLTTITAGNPIYTLAAWNGYLYGANTEHYSYSSKIFRTSASTDWTILSTNTTYEFFGLVPTANYLCLASMENPANASLAVRSTTNGINWPELFYTTSEGKSVSGHPSYFSQTGRVYYLSSWNGVVELFPVFNGAMENRIQAMHGFSSVVEVYGCLFGIGSQSTANWQSSPFVVSLLGNYNVAVQQPTIVTQPQSQFADAGGIVSFSVVASGGLVNYQWLFNGQDIATATNATFTLNSVTADDSGNYSVVVWNSAGAVTSTAAYLGVLTDGANGNHPTQIIPTPLPPKQPRMNNLILITHGWQPREFNPICPTNQPWMDNMTNAIIQYLTNKGLNDWQVEECLWLSNAWTVSSDTALNNAVNLGTQIGGQIAAQSWQYVHLIGHSAGAGLIQAAADALRSNSPNTEIQTTFLDPYVGFDNRGVSQYGKNADWSDEYYTPIDETSVDVLDSDTTGVPLPNAYRVDVSWLHILATVNYGSNVVPISSHEWPYEFYTETVSGTVSACAEYYGFPRSLEGGGWGSRSSYPIDNNPIAVPCGQLGFSQNPLPVNLGQPFSISLSPIALSEAGASLEGDAGFVLSSTLSAALVNEQSSGIQTLDLTPATNSPAWLAVGLTISNAVNFVQFAALFTDTNSAQGLLTVYWNTSQIGMVDERVAEANLQTYRFLLPGAVTYGFYTLSFHLDSFDNSSSIAVTNLTTGFVGVTQPSIMGILLTNGTPLVQLTAATNFSYLIQSSTNLVDWTPIALLFNTNGTILFLDAKATNSSSRFFRAVIP